MLKYLILLFILTNSAFASNRKVSVEFKSFLTRFEGVHHKVYNDHRGRVRKRGNGGYIKPRVGYLTVGVGHLLTNKEIKTGKILINGKKVNLHRGLTSNNIESLLNSDLLRVYAIIDKYVKIKLKRHQYDAITSFVFNLGYKAFFYKGKPNLLLRSLNKGNFKEVSKQMMRYKLSGGKVLRGLVLRRKAEVKLLMWRKYE